MKALLEYEHPVAGAGGSVPAEVVDPCRPGRGVDILIKRARDVAADARRRGDQTLTPSLLERLADALSSHPLELKPEALYQEHELKATLTEFWAAKLVFKRHGRDLRYVPGIGWRVWDGASWRDDQDDLATRRRVQDIGSMIVGAYNGLPDEAKQNDGVHKAFHAYKKECEKARTVDAIMKHLRCHAQIDATLTEWNADPYLINLPNGVLDLRTADLRPHERGLYLTQIGATPYCPDAECPRWEQFINEIFQGDQELINYIKWLCWYTLTGSTAHQFFCLLYGSGANGKSLFTSTLKYVMGREYGWSIESGMLLAQAQMQHSTGFADLYGKRLVIAPETPPNGRMDESAVKRLTGEDEITARKLYKDNIQFMPQCKLFICTNNKPRVADTSEGIWRRIQCIPFELHLKKQERDAHLPAKLRGEAKGILRWMVEGRRQAPLDRMPSLPKAIAAASEEYRRDEDILGQFLAECCTQAANCRVQSNKLYEAYKYWSGLKSLSNKSFSQDMKRKGFTTFKSMGLSMWEGISLIEGGAPEQPEPDYHEERPFWDRD